MWVCSEISLTIMRSLVWWLLWSCCNFVGCIGCYGCYGFVAILQVNFAMVVAVVFAMIL